MASDKQNQVPGGATSLSSALTEAQSIIEAAKRRAAEMQQEAVTERNAARKLGYEEGFEQGLANAAAHAVRLVEETASVNQRLAEEAAKLAVAICSNIISEQIKVDPEIVKRIALRALHESIVGDAVTIVVHPEDETLVASIHPELRRICGGGIVSIEREPDLARGGCIIRTEFGEVDASIESLIDTIAARLGIKRNV